jgi:Tol biopolymer transport system component
MWTAVVAASILAGSKPPPPAPRVVFASARTGVSQLYSVQQSGHRLAQLTLGGSADWRNLRVSPDGRFVAALHGQELWVMRPDGRGGRMLAPSADSITWSGDSRRLAFGSGVTVWTVTRAGGTPRRVTNGPDDILPSLSPDGRSIAFLRAGEPLWTLVVRRDGRETVVAQQVWGEPAWAPDGKWIAIQGPNANLELVRPGGGAPRIVASGVGSAISSQIVWSPDGRRLAYEAADGVHVVSAAGGAPRLVVKGLTHGISWSPSGKQIAYSTDRGVSLVTANGRSRTLTAFRTGEAQAGVGLATTSKGLRFRQLEPIPPLVEVSDRELRARVPIRTLAADGDRVAYPLCPHVLGAWRPGDASQVPLGDATVAACRPGYPQALYDLALAGDRLAYVVREGGIQVRWWLMVTSLARRDEGTVVASGADCCAGSPLLPPVGDVLGDGPLLVYGTWTGGTPESILRLDDQPLAVAAGAQPLSLDGGRIVARLADGSLELLAADGTVLGTFPVHALGAALAGDDLAVLVQGELRDYSASSGELLHAWPLPDVPSSGRCRRLFCPQLRLTLEDAARGLVLYSLDGTFHLLRLRDGADAAVPGATAAELEDSGLFYAYTGDAPWPGRIRFVPFAELPV